MTDDQTRRKAGRPRQVSAATIEATALQLFLDQGYEATTMPAIAEHCGVGRTTVFRYFPTKADLVWSGFDAHVAHLRALLAGRPASRPVMDSVLDAVIGAFEASHDEEGVWLTRYRVLRAAAELREAEWARWSDWRRAIAELVAERTGVTAGDVVPAAVGGAVLSGYLAVHDLWASTDGLPADPGGMIRRELRPVCAALETLVDGGR